MTRALPTPTEKGIFFFHKSETYELTCNYASCWWVTHPHQRTVVRRNWPVAMYISDVFTDKICENCGNNTYISPTSNIKFQKIHWKNTLYYLSNWNLYLQINGASHLILFLFRDPKQESIKLYYVFYVSF